MTLRGGRLSATCRTTNPIVHNQQSTAAAALVEKVTNGIDALLMRKVRAAGIDPRGNDAPIGMNKAMDRFYGDLSDKSREEIRHLAEESHDSRCDRHQGAPVLVVL